MSTKTIVLSLGVIILVAAGAYFFMQTPVTSVAEQAETNTTTPPPQGKLDMNAVCQGALAYMSFPDAGAADAFVKECIEGKHPEVIEQYRAQMNVGADVAL